MTGPAEFAETLRQSAADLTVVRISPADASALLVRMAHLEAMEQRARDVRDCPGDILPDVAGLAQRARRAAAREILGEE